MLFKYVKHSNLDFKTSSWLIYTSSDFFKNRGHFLTSSWLFLGHHDETAGTMWAGAAERHHGSLLVSTQKVPRILALATATLTVQLIEWRPKSSGVTLSMKEHALGHRFASHWPSVTRLPSGELWGVGSSELKSLKSVWPFKKWGLMFFPILLLPHRNYTCVSTAKCRSKHTWWKM